LLKIGNASPVICPSKDEDIAYIFYTSGTTGNPKGVLLSHRNVLADVDGVSQALQLEERQTVLCFLPLFHVNAMLTCTFSLGIGLTLVLRKNFSAGEFWEIVDRYKDEDNYIFIVDRIKDMVIRGGENIYSKEIDNLLATHPKIQEAATGPFPSKTAL